MSKKEMSEKQVELFNKLKKLAKRANQRIVRIERVFGKDVWAVKTLRNKLDIEPLQAWTKTGRVKYNKSMTITQLRATIKFVNNFLNSQTSTISGIKKVKKTQVKNIAVRLSIDYEELEDDEAELLYNLYNDKDFKFLTKEGFIPPSEFQALIEYSRQKNLSDDEFIETMTDYMQNGSDVDIRRRLSRIYKNL